MKSTKVIFQMILLPCMAIVLANCATGLSNNPNEPNYGKILKLHTKYFKIPIVNIGQLDSRITIRGQIEHDSVFGKRAKGHIYTYTGR